MSEILTTLQKTPVVLAASENVEMYWSFLARLSSSQIHKTSYACWMSNTIADIDFNRVISSRFPAHLAEEEIKKIIAHYQRHAKPFSWLVTPLSQPDSLRELLIDQGLTPQEMPLMAMDLQDLQNHVAVPPGLEIKLCETPALMQLWLEIYALNFSDAVQQLILEGHSERNLQNMFHAQFYLGLLHDQPVAISMNLLAAGVARIYAVRTIPQARRQGIGTLMTIASLIGARQQGYHIATLGATQMGYPLYQRLGFREYGCFSFLNMSR
jgi:GNAT superfamily N-acetyltransferase